MLTKNDVAQVYDTILSIPGMSETVKIDLKISRTSALLLAHVIDRGIQTKGDGTTMLDAISKESLQELETLSASCLLKAGLTDLNERLKTLEAVK